MRILQVDSIPPEIGGRTTGGLAAHVWELSTHLAKRGHEVAILADNLPNPEKAPRIKEEVRIYGFSIKHIRRFLPLALFELPKIIKLSSYVGRPLNLKGIVRNTLFYKSVFISFRPEIVHVHGPDRFPYVHFMLQGEIPKLITIHSFTPAKFELPNRQSKSPGLIPKNLRHVDNLISNSKLVERQLRGFFPEYKGNRWLKE